MPMYRFVHEAENNHTLEWIPLDVRRKLDLAGVKLSLSTWQLLSMSERRELCELDGEGALAEAFGERVIELSHQVGVEPKLIEAVGWPAQWSSETARQAAVDVIRKHHAQLAEKLTRQGWASLSDALRFALDRYLEEAGSARFASILGEIERALG
ncbi:MAG: nitrate reductase associated protein [Polyangiaceae bacterium]